MSGFWREFGCWPRLRSANGWGDEMEEENTEEGISERIAILSPPSRCPKAARPDCIAA